MVPPMAPSRYTPPMPRPMPHPARHGQRPSSGTIRIDIGWPYLVSAMMLLAATVLVPAFEDLDAARWQRDRALMLEAHRFERMLAHERYANALENHDVDLVRALALTQLNKVPADRMVLLPTALTGEASVFPSLEPEPLVLPERVETHSLL